jgi:hypothetical protein
MLLNKDNVLKLMIWEEIRKIKIHPGTVRDGFYQKEFEVVIKQELPSL